MKNTEKSNFVLNATKVNNPNPQFKLRIRILSGAKKKWSDSDYHPYTITYSCYDFYAALLINNHSVNQNHLNSIILEGHEMCFCHRL